MAHIIEVPEKAMPTTERCDSCGAQAWVEVAVQADSTPLLFCAAHFRQHEDKILALPEAKVADHRKNLYAQEQGAQASTAAQ